MLTLIDLGASRSCIRSGEPILNNVKIEPDSTKILAANHQSMMNHGSCILDVRLAGTHNFQVNPLIIGDLSYPLILGMDFIKSINYSKDNLYVTINDVVVKRYQPGEQTNFGSVSNNINLPVATEFTVRVENPLFRLKCPLIEVEPFAKILTTPTRPQFMVNQAVYENTQYIDIILTNFTSSPITIRKGWKIFSCKPIYVRNQSINGIKILKDDPNEEKLCAEFQTDRKNKYFKNGFVPEIGEIGEQLSLDKRHELKSLIQEKCLAFTAGDRDLGKCHYFRFTMPLKNDDDTAYETSRPVPYGIQSKVDDQINSWLEQDIIEVSSSRHNIPLIIIKKSDGTVRTSLDARKLNQMLIPDRFPLPNLRETIHSIGRKLKTGNEVYITILDLSKGYWQVMIDRADQSKLAFSYKNKQYVSKRCLYGVSTIPSAFCRLIMEIFHDVPDIFLYLDDICIVSTSWDDHMKALSTLFDRAIKYGLNLSAKKSKFAVSEFTFLGFKISKEGVNVSDKHLDAMKNYPIPTNKKELKSFLGVCAFNSRLVKNASIMLHPLHKLCSPKSPFIWTDEHTSAFEEFKTSLINSNGLIHRDEKLPLYLVTDASLNKYGGVLYQLNDDKFEPLAYHSGVFSNAERRMGSRHRELLGIVNCVRYFQYDLVGNKFTVFTDHQSLVNLMNARNRGELSMKILNGLIYLLNFEFDVIHKAGNDPIIQVADALSRTPVTKDDLVAMSERDEVPDRIFHMTHMPISNQNNSPSHNYNLRSTMKHILENHNVEKVEEPITATVDYVVNFGDHKYSRDDLQKLQNDDNYISNIIKKLQLKAKSVVNDFIMDDGLVFKLAHNNKRIVLPSAIAEAWLEFIHVVHGHVGERKLRIISKRDVYIYGLDRKCNEVINACVDCIRAKPRPQMKQVPKRHCHFENEPFAKVHIDLWDAGQKDRKGKRYFLGLTDSLTGFTDGICLSNKTEKLCVEALLTLIFRHGIFRGDVISDNGTEWSAIWQKVSEELHLRHIRTSPYHSRSNGRIERKFRDLNSLLRTHKIEVSSWSEHIPYVLFLINNLPSERLGDLSPNEALFGRSINLPYDVINPNKIDVDANFTKSLNHYLKKLHPILMENMYARFKHNFRSSKTGRFLKPGDEVFAYKPDLKAGKLACNYFGPLTVTRQCHDNTYELRCCRTGKIYRRNLRHLRRLTSRDEVKIGSEANLQKSEQHESTISNYVPNELDFIETIRS